MPDPFVRPDVQSLLDWLNALPGPQSHQVAPEEAREMMRLSTHKLDRETGELAVIRDLAAPGTAGDIPLRLFDRRSQRGPGPVLVFMHGGGFVLGDLVSYQPLCAEIARCIDLPVIAVDYRLAPEHPFPAAVEDAVAATRWIAQAPADLGLEPTGLILAGDSAGGNLAIVTALDLRDRPAALPLLAQWPIYPAADPAKGYPSLTDFGEGYLLTRDGMRWFDTCYAPDGSDWRYAPMLLDQGGLPPTLVVTASLDPIRDQGRAYAAECARAGVTTSLIELEGTIHGFMNMRRALPSAQQDLERCIDQLKLMIGMSS